MDPSRLGASPVDKDEPVPFGKLPLWARVAMVLGWIFLIWLPLAVIADLLIWLPTAHYTRHMARAVIERNCDEAAAAAAVTGEITDVRRFA